MKWQELSALAGAMMIASIGMAQASTVTFLLTGNDPLNPNLLPFSFMLSSGGLDLTVSGHSLGSGTAAGNTLTGGSFNNEKIGRYFGGVGIVTANDDDHQVDGRNSFGGSTSEIDEYIQFSFNQQVTILNADFSFVGYNDDFRWLVDTTMNGSIGIGDFISSETDIPGSTIFSSFNSTQASVFGIGAFRYYDEWKLKSVTIDYEMSAVPLPAALPLFGTGLAVMGFIGWRRKRKAAHRRS